MGERRTLRLWYWRKDLDTAEAHVRTVRSPSAVQTSGAMRILIDAYWWVEGPLSNRQVMREFVFAWATVFPADELILAVPRRHRGLATADVPPGVELVTTRLRPHGVAAILETNRLAKRSGADVALNQNFAPLRGRSAVFLHDVLFQTNPEWFTRAERTYFALMPLFAPRAGAVLTSTHNEAERIQKHNPKITNVVPVGLAVGSELLEIPPSQPSKAMGRARYMLSVGRLNVRKNLAFTFSAALESGVVSPELPLLVVGEHDGVGVELDSNVRAAVDDGSIVFLGQVTTGELKWLYQNARLFVFLSLDEGFGLPPLEALSFGCPVLVSDIPVFHETLGPEASYTDPYDLPSAAEAIARCLKPAAGRPDINPAQLPTWTGCVTQLREAVAALLK
jgi:glycosyltransferase involved in cell wall biosynthesis